MSVEGPQTPERRPQVGRRGGARALLVVAVGGPGDAGLGSSGGVARVGVYSVVVEPWIDGALFGRSSL